MIFWTLVEIWKVQLVMKNCSVLTKKSTRNCRLSEEIDVESERQTLLDIELQQQQQVEREYDFIMMEQEPPTASKMSEDLDAPLNSSLNVSLNRSGYAHILNDGVEIGIQTDPAVLDCPKPHVNKRNATEEVKSACARISSFVVYLLKHPGKPSKLSVKICIIMMFICSQKNKQKMKGST